MTAPATIRPEQHGTITGYSLGCHEACCRAANTARARRLRKLNAYGKQWPSQRVPAAPSRTTVQQLHGGGYSDRQLARYAGMNHAAIYRLRTGDGAYIARDTAERITAGAKLSATHPPVDRLTGRYVSAVGARRRLRALMAIGWPQSQLAFQLGRSPRGLSPLLYTDQRITCKTDAAIRDLYDRLWRTPGPSARSRQLAATFPTPLELDDDLLDDPTYTPTLHRPDALTEVRQRHEDRAERRAQVHVLTARGLSAGDIAARLGTTADIVHVDRRRTKRAS